MRIIKWNITSHHRLKKNKIVTYAHFLCTILGPDSSYSSLVIHISSNVLNDDNILPPIHTEYFLSGGAIILIFIESGANALISFCTLSAYPSNIVEPPEHTILPYNSRRISISH